MGMYTGLRARVKIKPEYRDAMYKLYHPEGDDVNGFWSVLNDGELPNLAEWKKVGRCNAIPCGCLAYIPDDFGEPFGKDGGHGFDGEWWTFSCSLKNYRNEIQTFFDLILKNIAEEIDYCQRLYEIYEESSELYSRHWSYYCTDYTL